MNTRGEIVTVATAFQAVKRMILRDNVLALSELSRFSEIADI